MDAGEASPAGSEASSPDLGDPGTLSVSSRSEHEEAGSHAARGGSESRKIDVCLLSGEVVDVFAASPPDADGLGGRARRVGRHTLPVRAVIESMTGARLRA
jgi:hypothetical protein